MYAQWTLFRFFCTSFSVCPACGPIGSDNEAVFVIGFLPQLSWYLEIAFGKSRRNCKTRGVLSLVNKK